jgi:transcriptional regulator GlxA family with amidase domain
VSAVTNIAILAYPGCLASEVTGLADLLHLANRLWTSENTNARKAPFSWRVLSTKARPVKTASGVALGAVRARRPRCDLLVVPGAGYVAPRGALGHLQTLRAELEVVRETSSRGVTVAAIGAGSVLLAEAGVPNGCRATSAWPRASVFADRYPAVERDRNATTTGDNKALSAGAVSGAYGVGMWIIERYHGIALARAVSQLVLPAPGRAMRASHRADRGDIQGADPLVLKVQQWLRQHFRKQVRITEVARRFGVTTRKLRRVFQAATGDTLIAYLQKLRVEHARTLLATRLPMAEVVRRSGYINASVFAELFKRYTKVTPTEYRKAGRDH